jgi:hypothetical protein
MRSCGFVTGSSNDISTAFCLDKPVGLPSIPHMKELLRSNDPTVIAFAKALLSGEDISVFEMDVHMSMLEGSVGILPRRLMVADQDLFMARAVMRDNEILIAE